MSGDTYAARSYYSAEFSGLMSSLGDDLSESDFVLSSFWQLDIFASTRAVEQGAENSNWTLE